MADALHAIAPGAAMRPDLMIAHESVRVKVPGLLHVARATGIIAAKST